MTIADQINRLNNAKAAIKESIENKGVSVSDSAKLDEYPALIDSIEVGSGGGGGDSTYVNPDFYEVRTIGGTNYEGLFYYYHGETLDLSNWNTNNVTDMNSMFYGCSNLTSLDVSNFDTSKVTDMNNMFYGCSKLTTLDLSNFNTSNVTNMGRMFYSCNNITIVTGELDLSGLTSGFYSGSTIHPLYGFKTIETLYLKNIYKNCTMTNASKWSINLGGTKIKDECLLYIINELPDLKNDKGLTATDKIVFTLPKTNTLTQEQVQVAIDKGWSVANTTY